MQAVKIDYDDRTDVIEIVSTTEDVDPADIVEVCDWVLGWAPFSHRCRVAVGGDREYVRDMLVDIGMVARQSATGPAFRRGDGARRQ
jgi:hypothetical protein